jgi:dimethylaniline monooxygenase (N-oxide forming)
MSNEICVIGAGIAGLVTAKVLRADGFEVTVFERDHAIGGVWAASRTYPELRANNSRDTYAFSDFPYPSTADDFPSAPQVRAYLEDYARHFRVLDDVEFGVEVVRVARRGGSDAGFDVTVRRGAAEETRRFDYVAVCNGTFPVPIVPEIPGLDRFAGTVAHSSGVVDPEAARGKRVVVVGGAKSAFDTAAWAAAVASSCTLVHRTPAWMAPRYFFGRFRAEEVVISRFSEAFLRPYHRASRFEHLLHGPLGPLVRLHWKMVSSLIRNRSGMPAAMLPDSTLPDGFEKVGVGGDFYRVLVEGRVNERRSSIREIDGPSAVVLENGERLEADLLVFATGYRQDLGFLTDELRASVHRDGDFRLYRRILPPRERRLGFVGYASSFAAQLTSEIAAHWLSESFLGRLELPDEAAMEEEIDRVLAWNREVFPGRPGGYFIGPYLAHYVDELMRDMGQPCARTRSSVLEYFGPYRPSQYATLAEDRRSARAISGSPSGAPRL